MGLRLQGLMFPWRLPCLRILQHLQLQRFVASESVARCSSKAMSMEAVQRRDPEEEEDEKLGVLIVGAGPVGLTLSILLSSYGKLPCGSRYGTLSPSLHYALQLWWVSLWQQIWLFLSILLSSYGKLTCDSRYGSLSPCCSLVLVSFPLAADMALFFAIFPSSCALLFLWIQQMCCSCIVESVEFTWFPLAWFSLPDCQMLQT